jgi:predicted nucleic acid-binding protein
VKLAADANVLLSAILGGRAELVLHHPAIQEILTTDHTFAEVEEYAPVLAKKRGIPLDIVILAVAALNITIVDSSTYKRKLPEAFRQIGDRDPDDTELLALALQLKIPIWSNDQDFKSAKVELFSTEEALRHLGLIK